MTTANSLAVTLMTDKHLVVQHNKIIEAKYKLSVGEQRLIKYLISMIDKEDEDFKVYRISVADLSRLMDTSDNDMYRKVKVSSKKLISNVLTFEGLDGRELQVSWLSSAEYIPKEGVVELEFSPKLKPFLLQLKKYFKAYELGNIIHLKHTYSIRIYELLKQYETIGHRRFLVENLRTLLMIGDDEYKQFSDFRKRILVAAQKELNEKTDISFTWDEEMDKEGRKQKCVAIVFFIKPQVRKLSEEFESVAIAPPSPPQDTGKRPAGNGIYGSVFQKLVGFGVAETTAEALVNEYGGQRIEYAIAHAQAQQKEGKVKNMAGFLVESVRSGYVDNQAEERNKKQAAAQEAKAREERARNFENLKRAYAEAKNARFHEWREMLGEQAVAEHRKRHMETVSPLLRKHGSIMEQLFLAHLKDLMRFPRLREWAKQSRIPVEEFEEELAAEERQAAAMAVRSGTAA